MRPFVSGLVLAAGASTRLGQPKQLLPLRGTTLLGGVLDQTRAATALDEVVVVLGAAAGEIRRRVNLDGAAVVENTGFAEGCSGSYRTGIAALDPRAEAVVVVLGDQPGIEAAVIDRVVDGWRARRPAIAAAAYANGLGHPLVFARALFEQLVGLKGDKAAWKILDAHPDWIHAEPIAGSRPADVNTWTEYEALLGR